MHKGQAQAEQFYARTGSEATKGSRKGYSLLGEGDCPLDHLTDEQKRDSLVAHYKQLLALRATPPGKVDKALGLALLETNQRISALRKKARSVRSCDIPSLFMDICRERMGKLEFNRYMDEANRRQRANKSESE